MMIEAGFIILVFWLMLYAANQPLIKFLSIIGLIQFMGLLWLKLSLFPELEWLIVLGMPTALFISGIGIERAFRNLGKNR